MRLSLDNLFGVNNFGAHKLYVGPMGSQKTLLLFKEIKNLQYKCENDDLAGFGVLLAKPALDTRRLPKLAERGMDTIQSRDGVCLENVYLIGATKELYELYKQAKDKFGKVVVGISEIEFMDNEILHFIRDLGKEAYLVCEGLDTNFRGEAFLFGGDKATTEGTMYDLKRLFGPPNVIYCDTAICSTRGCNNRADYTQREVPYFDQDGTLIYIPAHWNSKQLVIGDERGEEDGKPQDRYTARCFLHHQIPGKDLADYVRASVNLFCPSGLDLEELRTIKLLSARDDEYQRRYPGELDATLDRLVAEKHIVSDGTRLFPSAYLTNMVSNTH